MSTQPAHDLTRTTLLVLIVCGLIAASLWTMLPFIGALIWAATMVAATWPLLLKIQRGFEGRRWAATTVMTLLMLIVFVVPFLLAMGMLMDAATQGVDLVRTYFHDGLGPAPEWISKVPWVGTKLAAKWQGLAAGGPDAFAAAVQPHLRAAAAWTVATTGGIGMTIVHFLLILILSAVLYTQGETATRGVVSFARRIGGERGERAVVLAGSAVRSVALGVIVTALVQSVLAWLGLWISGVPRPGLLTAAVFALCVAQLGPWFVLIPAVVWMYWSGDAGWGTALLVWSVLVGVLDNVLRPILIRRGVDLPILLIIAGVIGGLIGFGVIGLFVGPVILAVTYTLLGSWIHDDVAGEH